MQNRGKAGTLLLITLGLALALTLAWLLFPGSESAPTFEPDLQPASDPASSKAAAHLPILVPADKAVDTPTAVSPSRTAVSEAAAGDFVPLTGLVLARESGELVEGARIGWFGPGGGELGSSVTSADGSFESPVPANAIASLRVAKPEFATLFRTLDGPPGFLELRLEPACELVAQLEVRGSTTWSEVEYQLWLPVANTPGRAPIATQVGDETLTEARFVDLGAGTYELGAKVPGHGWAYRSNLTLRAGESLVVPLEIQASTTLSGRVTLQDSREPVGHAKMTIRPRRQGIARRALEKFSLETKTDEAGTYRFEGLTPGEHVVYVKNGNLLHAETFDLVSSGVDELRDIEIPPPATLSGRIVTESGDGLAAAQITASVRGTRGRGSSDGIGPWFAASDAHGDFHFTALPSGRELRVEATVTPAKGTDPVLIFGPSLRLRRGEERTDYQIVSYSAREVAGTVVDADSKPIVGARVRAHAEPGEGRITGEASSDDQGEFRFDVFTERFAIRADAEGYSGRWMRVDLREGVEREPLLVELKPVSVLTGKVLDPEGSSVPFARVEATPSEDSGDRGRRRGRRVRTRADEFGRFSISGLAEGVWNVSAANGGWIRGDDSTAQVQLPTSESITLILTRDPSMSELPVTLRGAVRFDDGSIPVGVRFENLRGGALVVDGDRFELTGVRPGRMAFTVTADDSTSSKLDPIDLAPGGVYDLGTIELGYATDLRVVVRGPGGATQSGASVLLRTPPAEVRAGTPEKRIRIRKDSRAARYRLRRAPRGRYQLIVRREGFKAYRKLVTVGKESPQTIQVRLTASN